MRFFGEFAHVIKIAGQKDSRSELREGDCGEQRVQSAAVTGEAAATENLAGMPSALSVYRDNRDLAEDAVNGSIRRAAAQNLRERCRGRDDVSALSADRLKRLRDTLMTD